MFVQPRAAHATPPRRRCFSIILIPRRQLPITRLMFRAAACQSMHHVADAPRRREAAQIDSRAAPRAAQRPQAPEQAPARCARCHDCRRHATSHALRAGGAHLRAAYAGCRTAAHFASNAASMSLMLPATNIGATATMPAQQSTCAAPPCAQRSRALSAAAVSFAAAHACCRALPAAQ